MALCLCSVTQQKADRKDNLGDSRVGEGPTEVEAGLVTL